MFFLIIVPILHSFHFLTCRLIFLPFPHCDTKRSLEAMKGWMWGKMLMLYFRRARQSRLYLWLERKQSRRQIKSLLSKLALGFTQLCSKPSLASVHSAMTMARILFQQHLLIYQLQSFLEEVLVIPNHGTSMAPNLGILFGPTHT